MNKNHIKRVLLLSLIVSLSGIMSGCGFMQRDPAPTPYQPYQTTNWHSIPDSDGNILGGYTEQHIKGNRYSVTFKGNGVTDRPTVTRYVHQRAEELCKQNGYKSYITMNRGEMHDTEYSPQGIPYAIVTLNILCKG